MKNLLRKIFKFNDSLDFKILLQNNKEIKQWGINISPKITNEKAIMMILEMLTPSERLVDYVIKRNGKSIFRNYAD